MIANSGEYRKKNGQRGCVMMNNFIFENKTKVYFGKGGVKEYLGGLLANFGETVMLAYGGGSIKRNGVYDEIMGILNAAGKRIVEFSGIMSNPTYGRVKGGDKKPLPQPFQTLYTGKWIMYNNGPVTASSFSFQKRTAVPIKEAVAAFLLYFQSPLAVFLDFNSFPNILRPEFPLCSTHAYGILCGQRQSLAKAAPAKDLSFLDTQIQPAKSHFARQNHTAVVTTKTMYYYSCFFRRYPVK